MSVMYTMIRPSQFKHSGRIQSPFLKDAHGPQGVLCTMTTQFKRYGCARSELEVSVNKMSCNYRFNVGLKLPKYTHVLFNTSKCLSITKSLIIIALSIAAISHNSLVVCIGIPVDPFLQQFNDDLMA